MSLAPAALLTLLCLFGSPQPSQDPQAVESVEESPVVLAPGEQYAAEVDVAQRLGSLLYTKVRLVEEATAAAELVVDRRTLGLAHLPVVVSRNGLWTVRFVGAAGDRVISYYDVIFSAEGVARVRLLDSPQTVPAEEGSLYRAKLAAMQAMPFKCPVSYEAVGLPSLEDSGWTVYLLPQADTDEWISIGGHLRAEVSRSGDKVKSIGALTAGCSKTEANTVAAGDGFWIMHTRSAAPHEVHVYLSLIHDLPLFVGTWQGAWAIEDGAVEFAYSWGDQPR